MTKEEFIKRIEIIEKFRNARSEMGKKINALLEDGRGIFTFGQEILDAWIKDISIMSKISDEAIEMYLYEGCGLCKWEDGFEMDIQTPSDLWDFEKHKIKNNHANIFTI